MTDTLSPTQTGTAAATVCGTVHLLWTVLIAAGAGPRLIELMETMHFLQPNALTAGYTTTSATLWTAVAGILAAAATGYIIGLVFAWSYNQAARFTR